jgi:prepilin-type processing-associated H-X9-DG protein
VVAAHLYVQLLNAVFIGFPKPASPADRAAHCRGNLRQIGQAVAAYRADYDDHYPPAAGWQRALGPYGPTPLTWTCPSAAQEPGYRTNARLGGVRFAETTDPAHTLAAWDAGADVPGHSPVPEARMRRHSGLDNFLFADGSVKALPDGHGHRVDPTD